MGLFKDQVVWSFLFGFEYGSDSMGFDLWRLFAGAMLMQTMFNLCSYRNLKEEKNKECFDSEIFFFIMFYMFLTVKTIMWVTEVNNGNHG